MRGFRRQFAIGSATKDRLNIVKIPYNNILAWRSGTYNRNDHMAAYIAKSTSVCLNSEFEYINIDPLKKYEMIISTNKYNNLYNMQIFINQLNDKGECIDTLSFYNTNDKIPLTFLQCILETSNIIITNNLNNNLYKCQQNIYVIIFIGDNNV